MYDIIIVGTGPAGITAGIYAKRAGMNVLILYSGKSNLEKSERIDNYYGFPNGIDGNSLYQNGIKQAKNLDIKIENEEVLSISKDEFFEIKTNSNSYNSKSVIIATGNKKLKPNIKGIDEFDGKGISYCAICDGFFYRNKNIAIIGDGQFALSEANHLKSIVSQIIILTNGNSINNKENYLVNEKKIIEISGDTKVRQIEFEDGSKIDIDGIFIAIGKAGGVDFAKKMGIITKNESIVVNEKMETNIDGLFACGDVCGGLLQICKSTYEGAKAGLSAVNYIKNNPI